MGSFRALRSGGKRTLQDLMQITKLPFLTRECPLQKEDRKAPVSALLHGEPETSLRYLHRRESRASVEAVLQDCSHNGFPIVSETGQLVGLVAGGPGRGPVGCFGRSGTLHGAQRLSCGSGLPALPRLGPGSKEFN